jgi:hypothetical protein
MLILILILFSGIITNNSRCEDINIADLIQKMNVLEKLEKSISESISDGKLFEHDKLSLKWYDKFIYFYWNTEYNKLYLSWDGSELDVKNIIECAFHNNCLLESSYKFNMKYMYGDEYIDFIINVKKLVEWRLEFLYKNMSSS